MMLIRRFAADERGATAIEYGLIIAIISAFILGSMSAFEAELARVFTKIKDAFNNI